MASPAERRAFSRTYSVLSRTIIGFFSHGAPLIAGHLAFMLLLTLFPFLVFLVALAGFIGNTEAGTVIVAFIFENMPENVAVVFEGPILEVLQELRGGLLTLSVAGALWTAASALEGARAGVERAFAEQSPAPFWRRRLESIALVVVGGALLVLGVTALLLAPVLWQDAASRLGFQNLPAMELGPYRTFLGVFSVFVLLSALYAMLPAKRPPWRGIFPGAALTLVLWGLAVATFTLYLRNFGAYGVTYGSLGGVVVAMVFFYLLGAIFLFGAELNAALATPPSSHT